MFYGAYNVRALLFVNQHLLRNIVASNEEYDLFQLNHLDINHVIILSMCEDILQKTYALEDFLRLVQLTKGEAY